MPGRSRHRGALLVVAGTAALVYASTLAYDFVWDDVYVVRGLDMSGWSTLPRLVFSDFFNFRGEPSSPFFRPLAVLSFFLDFALWGRHPAGFHLTNILGHVAASIAVFWLGWRLTASEIAAVAAGMLFAVHPVHTESVAFISGRTDVFAALFVLIGVLAYARWRDDGRGRRRALSLLAFALGLLMKEVAVILPLLLVVYDGAVLRELQTRRAWRLAIARYVPYGVTVVIYLALRKAVLPVFLETGQTAWADALSRALTAFKMAAWDVRLAVLPYPITVTYDVGIERFPPGITWWLSVALLAALVALTLLALRRWPALGFGAAWFWIALIPVLGGSALVARPIIADRFLCLPTVGSCLLAGVLFARLLGEATRDGRVEIRWAPAIGLSLLLLAYTGFTFWRNEDWKDAYRLTYRMLQNMPRDVSTRLVLAQSLMADGRFAAAHDHLVIAANVSPDDPVVLAALGFAECHLGDRDRGLAHARRAAQLAPNHTGVLDYLARVYVERGETREAAAVLERSLQVDPHRAIPTLTLALLYQSLGDDAAVVTLERGRALNDRVHDADLFADRVAGEVYATRDPRRARAAWQRYITGLRQLSTRAPETEADLAYAERQLDRLARGSEATR